MAAPFSSAAWDEASTPAVALVVRQFEHDWQAAPRHRRPDPLQYVASDAASGTRLALLRAEMNLCWEAGEPVHARAYFERYPDLDDETLVALVYEEFCLAEESGQNQAPDEFYRRYPEIAARLKRVLAIHDLVGSGRTGSFPPGLSATVAFPEAGQTIAGFLLVEELGRGAFARVFRAAERQLADRPVALKVARTGSREPQTLARLQHTHIVPVHSSRTDPVTGLHLLCMPYLGCVTLARLLADEQVRHARSGQEILEALDRLEPSHRIAASPQAAGRVALASRTYVRAMAWWGARLAEALQHAQERGVLHRDVKPSNVLVTGDGLPMLLDFNLAWEACIDDPEIEPATLGGTLAYMAPEHIDALAADNPGGIDHRSDIYSLGVVLYEAMGSRPFEPPRRARSVAETLQRAAAERRAGAVPLRDRHPEVPPEFQAVVQRCLAPDPADRYNSAAELAADLQAVADNQPLRFARETLSSRCVRWFHRNRDRLVVTVPLIAAAAIVTLVMIEEHNEHDRLLDDTRQLISEGMILAEHDRLDLARTQFELASKLASSEPSAPPATPRERTLKTVRLTGSLDDLRAIARAEWFQTGEKLTYRRAADTLAETAETLRLRLLGFVGPVGDPSAEIAAALQPFYVFQAPSWPTEDLQNLVDPRRRSRLLDDVEDLLFLWTLALDRRLETAPAADRATILAQAQQNVNRALGFTPSPRPWQALQARLATRRAGQEPPRHTSDADQPVAEPSDRACFEWGLLRSREGQLRAAIAWLDRAARRRPDRYWYHLCLALAYEQASRDPFQTQPLDGQKALAHYGVAIALHADDPWPWLYRARLHAAMGAWARALEDFEAAAQRLQPGDDRELLRMLATAELPWLRSPGLALLNRLIGRAWTAPTAPAQRHNP